jgi:hypothetical protein
MAKKKWRVGGKSQWRLSRAFSRVEGACMLGETWIALGVAVDDAIAGNSQ